MENSYSSRHRIIAQRLARRTCVRCREAYTPSSGLLEKLKMEDPNMVFYRGKGCAACMHTGYWGRTGIYELLVVEDAIRHLIMSGADSNVIKREAVKQGMLTLLQDGADKVSKGITTVEEVLRVTQE